MMTNNKTANDARYIVTRAIACGDIPPASALQCEKCGNQARLYHHEDYSAPLDVNALCSICHGVIHSQLHQEQVELQLKVRQGQSPDVKFVTATEFNKQFTAVYKMLEILQSYKAIHITRHGKLVLVIHRPDAVQSEFEGDDE